MHVIFILGWFLKINNKVRVSTLDFLIIARKDKMDSKKQFEDDSINKQTKQKNKIEPERFHPREFCLNPLYSILNHEFSMWLKI